MYIRKFLLFLPFFFKKDKFIFCVKVLGEIFETYKCSNKILMGNLRK